MAYKKIQLGKDWIEGIVDVGLIVISHFENPAKDIALEFISDAPKVEEEVHNPYFNNLGSLPHFDKISESRKSIGIRSLYEDAENSIPSFLRRYQRRYDLGFANKCLRLQRRILGWLHYSFSQKVQGYNIHCRFKANSESKRCSSRESNSRRSLRRVQSMVKSALGYIV